MTYTHQVEYRRIQLEQIPVLKLLKKQIYISTTEYDGGFQRILKLIFIASHSKIYYVKDSCTQMLFKKSKESYADTKTDGHPSKCTLAPKNTIFKWIFNKISDFHVIFLCPPPTSSHWWGAPGRGPGAWAPWAPSWNRPWYYWFIMLKHGSILFLSPNPSGIYYVVL